MKHIKLFLIITALAYFIGAYKCLTFNPLEFDFKTRAITYCLIVFSIVLSAVSYIIAIIVKDQKDYEEANRIINQ